LQLKWRRVVSKSTYLGGLIYFKDKCGAVTHYILFRNMLQLYLFTLDDPWKQVYLFSESFGRDFPSNLLLVVLAWKHTIFVVYFILFTCGDGEFLNFPMTTENFDLRCNMFCPSFLSTTWFYHCLIII